MRKNSIRNLVHGILDLLPLFVIPIFAININQKSVDPISIEVQEQISVDFNQKVKNCDFVNGLTNWSSASPNNAISLVNNKLNYLQSLYAQTRLRQTQFNTTVNHKYLIKSYLVTDTDTEICFELSRGWTQYRRNVVANTYTLIQGIVQTISATDEYNWLQFFTQVNNVNTTFDYINIYDLTKMYGEGNEPTINEFNTSFSNTYYEYIESQKMLVNKPTPTTYDSTDIGSQFLYSLYISTDKYFNMNQVFNLNSVYSWFELNIFGGSAPLSIYIVWNVIIFELVMDLLILLYSVFMFFIDMSQKLMDKPLNSIK